MHERMMDKTSQPSDADMVNWIGQPIAEEWIALRQFLAETYAIVPIFNTGGKRYGWNLQYRIGGRPLCEMYPEHGSFTALVILGKAELAQAMERIESFGSIVRTALADTPRYHDGCWMYIRVSDPLTCRQDVQDIQQLIMIKRKPPRKTASPSEDTSSRGNEATSDMIDNRITELGDWRGKTLERVRRIINKADPEIVEEWKWRKPSSPGTPVWSHSGGICTGETYKSVVKLTFFKGAALKDPSGLFNASLEGKVRRAIDIHEGDDIDEAALKALIQEAVALNLKGKK